MLYYLPTTLGLHGIGKRMNHRLSGDKYPSKDYQTVHKYSLWEKNKHESLLKTWLIHLLSSMISPLLSRMSEQQSSMMSSQGDPKEKFSVEHCWLVDPITNPILQASQQSWEKMWKTTHKKVGWQFFSEFSIKFDFLTENYFCPFLKNNFHF